MRKTVLILNATVAIFFAGFLIYLLFAQSHVESLAREFVANKTQEYAEPVVEAAEQTLQDPLLSKLIPKNQKAAIKNEIAAFKNDQIKYIADLIAGNQVEVAEAKRGKIQQKVREIKMQIRDFYEETLAALIRDLRIFSFSNLIASLLGFVFAYRWHGDVPKSAVVFSIALFISVLFCSHLYIDELSFFQILTRTHMGWLYPCFVAVMAGGTYWQYETTRKEQESKEMSQDQPADQA